VHFLVRYRRTFAWCFLLAYILMLSLSPVQEARYIWPLYPILAYSLVNGLEVILRSIKFLPPLTKRAPAVAFGTLVVLATLATFRAYRAPVPPSLLGNADVQALFSWLKTEQKHAPHRVVFINPRVLAFATGIPAMAPIYARNPRIIDELEKLRITDVILGDLGTKQAADRTMKQLIDEMPERFSPVYENPSFKVFHFARSPGIRTASQ
ncbi:MAG: hypothetical protein ABI877_12230, partial [Gemmatimonadaceae bacterium]